MRARLPIEHLPPHSCQKDEDDNSIEKFMVNLKLLGEKQLMLIKIFSKHRSPRKSSMIEKMADRQSLKLEIKYGMLIPGMIQERETYYRQKSMALFLISRTPLVTKALLHTFCKPFLLPLRRVECCINFGNFASNPLSFESCLLVVMNMYILWFKKKSPKKFFSKKHIPTNWS